MLEDEAEKLIKGRAPEDRVTSGRPVSSAGVGRRFGALNKAAQQLQKQSQTPNTISPTKSAPPAAGSASIDANLPSNGSLPVSSPKESTELKRVEHSPSRVEHSNENSVTSSNRLANVEQAIPPVMSSKHLADIAAEPRRGDSSSKRLAKSLTSNEQETSSKRRAESVLLERLANVEQNKSALERLANVEQSPVISNLNTIQPKVVSDSSSKRLAGDPALNVEQTSSKIRPSSPHKLSAELNVEQTSSKISPSEVPSQRLANVQQTSSELAGLSEFAKPDDPSSLSSSKHLADILPPVVPVIKAEPFDLNVEQTSSKNSSTDSLNRGRDSGTLNKQIVEPAAAPENNARAIEESDSGLKDKASLISSEQTARMDRLANVEQSPSANVYQTPSKPLANNEQSPSKLGADVEQTSSKHPAKVYQTSSERPAKHLANVEQETAVELLSGHERHFLDFIYQNCKQMAALETRELTAKEIAGALGLLEKSSDKVRKHISNLAKRLIDKRFIERARSKVGKSGWATYRITKNLYQRLLDLEQSPANRLAERLQSAPINVLITKNNLNNNRSGENQEKGDGPTANPYLDISLSSVTAYGLGPKHLYDIHRNRWDIAPEVLGELIERFPAYVEAELKGKDQSLLPRIFLALVKAKATTGECGLDYVQTEQDLLVEAELQKLEQLKVERIRRKEEFFNAKFEDWVDNLSEAELAKIPNINTVRSEPAKRAQMRSYFTEHVWPGLSESLGIRS